MCIYVCIHIHLYTCIYICIHTYIHIKSQPRKNMWDIPLIWIGLYGTYENVYSDIHTNTYIYVCVYICTHINIYI